MTESEFSRNVSLQRIADEESQHAIDATEEECRALARRFDLVSLDFLHADIRLRRMRGGKLIALAGRVLAAVVQRCVVTLAPVAAVVDESFSLLFDAASAGGRRVRRGEAELYVDPLADEPEPLEGDSLDIGEIAAQQFALALDPYPRAPGATLEEGVPEGFRGRAGTDEDAENKSGGKRSSASDDRPDSPFAALARLRPKPPGPD